MVEALVHRVRPRRGAAAAGESVLVPVARLRDGDGLALVGDHDQRARRAQARAGAGRGRARAARVRRSRAPLAAARRTSCWPSATRVGLDGAALARTSRLVAKVDSAAVQDGFELYLHGFIVADDGAWTVVQQGMNAARRQARRYHWLWERAGNFVDEPHAAIEGLPGGRHPQPHRPARGRARAPRSLGLGAAPRPGHRHSAAAAAPADARPPRRARRGHRSRAARRGAGGVSPTVARTTSPSCC